MNAPGPERHGLAPGPGRYGLVPESERHGASPSAPVANAPSGVQPAGLEPVPPPSATPTDVVHLVGNAHLDPVWLWPWQEGYQEARATFWSAIHRLDEYPDFVFTCDQVVLLAWVKESDPALFEQIRRRVAEGRWVNVGGWWVEPDANLPMGESFARQGLYGQRFLLAEFGRAADVGMNADPFGHNAALPMILRAQGMDSYTFLRPGPHESPLFDTPFWWTSPDGSRVLTARIPFEYCSPPGDISGQIEKAVAQQQRPGRPLLVFYGVGNHGGGPTRATLESIHRYQRMGTFGTLRMTSLRAFFDAVAAHAGDLSLPTWDADLQHHAVGCYSAHSGIKAWQRRAQHAVLTAERWAAVADVLNRASPAHNPALDYPRADLERAWKQVLFNQFHDVLPGSAIESAYEDARDHLGEAIAISKRLTARAHNVIAQHIDLPLAAATQPVVVFNHHPWAVEASVEVNYGGQPYGVHVLDGAGAPVASQRMQPVSTTSDRSRGATVFEASLPPFGYAVYTLQPGERTTASALHASTTGLENAHLRVTLDPLTGWLTGLLDKRTGVDVLAHARGPHCQVCADPTDTWGHRVVSYAWPGADMPVTRCVLREDGPVRARVRVEHGWGSSTLVEEFVLDARASSVRVDVTLDWHEPAHLLKLRMPVGLAEPVATFDIPYATLVRPVDGAEQPAQSWVDLTGTVDGHPAGLALVFDGKHGCDVSPAESPLADTSPSIGMTAVRSPVYAWHDPRLLDDDAVYSYHDQGVQRFSYLLVPHGGDWRTADLAHRASELGAPPRAMLESFHPGPYPRRASFVAGDGVLVTALKGSEDTNAAGTTDLVVRAVEVTGRPATAHIDLPIAGRRLDAAFSPYQLRTFRVPADPDEPVSEVNLLEQVVDLAGALDVTVRDRLPAFGDAPLSP